MLQHATNQCGGKQLQLPLADGRKKGLDGLRALAVILVFATHRTGTGYRLGLGGYGVHLFFVLSGFLIIDILVRDRARIETGLSTFKDEWLGFMQRRSFRIFPAYYIVVALLIALTWTGFLALSWPTLFMFSTYTSNIDIAYRTLDYPQGGGHLWSLAIEEQFYLVSAPLFLSNAARHARVICFAVLAVAVGSSAVVLVLGFPMRSLYVGSLSNFGLMAMGGIAALTPNLKRLPHWVAPTALLLYFGTPIVSVFTNFHEWLFWVSPLFVAVSLPLIVRDQASWYVRALEIPPLRKLGRVSYGFYLFHTFIDIGLWFPVIPKLAVIALNFGIATSIAAISWRYVEAPLLKIGRELAHSTELR